MNAMADPYTEVVAAIAFLVVLIAFKTVAFMRWTVTTRGAFTF